MLCAIWYHWYNFKNMKNTHGGVILLVKLQTEARNFTRCNTLSLVFFTCFKSDNSYQIVQIITVGFAKHLEEISYTFVIPSALT